MLFNISTFLIRVVALCRSVQFEFSSVGFYWLGIWRARKKLIKLSINQDVDLLSTSSSLLSLFALFSLSLSFVYIYFFDPDTTDSLPLASFVFLLLSFHMIPLSVTSHALFAYLTVMAAGRLMRMKVGRVGEGSPRTGTINGEEENDRICSHFCRHMWQCCVREKIQKRGVMGACLVSLHLTRARLCFNESWVTAHIYSYWLRLRFQNSCSGSPLNGFC